MKNTALLLIITSIAFINTAHAEKIWVKSTKGCTLSWDTSNRFRAVEWSGRCKNGYASGHGVAKYYMMNKTQDIYHGNMKKGKLHGYGRYQWANGDRYTGYLKKSQRHGKGTYIWQNGERYTGSWKKDKKHGKGKVIWNTPYRNIYKSFAGTFYQDSRKKGVYTTINGRKVAKKENPVADLNAQIKAQNSAYLNLISGYSINRHAHHGN